MTMFAQSFNPGIYPPDIDPSLITKQIEEIEFQIAQPITLTTAAFLMRLPAHNHIRIRATGDAVQWSRDGQTFLDFLNAGDDMILDGHTTTKNFFIRAAALTATVNIWTW